MIWNLALIAAAQHPGALCSPTTSAGWVASIESIRGSRTDVPSVLGRDGVPRPLMPAQLICEGDVVRNPAGSSVVLRLRLSRRLITLPPGSPPYRVAAPGWIDRAGNLARNIADAFEGYRQSRNALSTAGVRGSELNCIVSPTSRGRADNYVLAEVPIRISWKCGPGTQAFHVTIRSGGSRREFETNSGLLTLDVLRDCPEACSISVSDHLFRSVVDERLTVLRAEQVPGNFSLAEPSPAVSALAGARLVTREDPWRLLGASLLWKSACDIPAAAIAANLAYGLGDPEMFCEERLASSPRGGDAE